MEFVITDGPIDEMSKIAKAHNCNTDKVGQYLSFYDSLWNDFRDEYKKVCEIGVKHGGSIRLWAEYFPNANVYAIDAIQENYDNVPDHERVFGFFGNTRERNTAKEFEQTFGGDFDFILDDGCHQTSAQQIALGSFFPLVKSGGYYVIEDILACLDPHYTNADGSDRITTAIKSLEKTGKLGEAAMHMTKDEIDFVQDNCDSVIWHPENKAAAIKKK